MTNEEIINYAKRGKKYSDVVLLNEANNVTFLLGTIMAMGTLNNKEEEYDNEVEEVYIKVSEKTANKYDKLLDDLTSEINRILTIEMYLLIQYELMKMIGKYSKGCKKYAKFYIKEVRKQTYPEEIIETEYDLF